MINYILLPVFLLFVIIYKFWNKTKLVRLEDMDIWSGRRELTESEELETPKQTKSWWARIYSIVIG